MVKRFYIKDGIKYVRVNRTKARNLYISGYPVVFCPCNLRPGSSYQSEMEFVTQYYDANERKDSFKRRLYSFMYYNCNWETGLYPSFYVSAEILENL